MTTMKVTPEGRPDLWLVTPDEITAWLDNHRNDDNVWHSFIPRPGLMLGADWDHQAVVDLARKPGVRIAINTDIIGCMAHHLAIADDDEGRLTVFDIGHVTVGDLEVVDQ